MNNEILDNLKNVVASLTSEIAQRQGIINGINSAIETLTNGYQSDQAKIDEAIASAKADADKQIIDLKSQITNIVGNGN